MGQVEASEITLIETVEDASAVQPPEDCDLAFATQTTLSTDETAKLFRSAAPFSGSGTKEDICYAHQPSELS